MRYLGLILLLIPLPAPADIVIAARTIRAHSIITAQDLQLRPGEGLVRAEALIGQEARVSLYAGRPINPADVGPPAVVERNQIVPLIYDQRGIRIVTEGRALDRAGADQVIRVMNISSRSTVSGRVLPDGRIMVGQE